MPSAKDLLAVTKQVRIPLNAYKIKVIEPSFELSKEKKTPYLSLECETQGNSPIMVDGTMTDINGQKGDINIWITDKNAKRIVQYYQLAGIPLPEIEASTTEEAATKIVAKILENPMPELWRGKTFRATCVSTPSPQLTEEKEPILDSKGQALVYWRFEIKDLI